MFGPSRLDAKLPVLGWATRAWKLEHLLVNGKLSTMSIDGTCLYRRSTLGRLPLSRPSRRWSRRWGSGSWAICIFDPVLRHQDPMDRYGWTEGGLANLGKNRLRSDVGIVLRDMSRCRPPESRVPSPHRGVRSGTWLDFALFRCADWRRKNRPTNNPRKQKGRRVAGVGSIKVGDAFVQTLSPTLLVPGLVFPRLLLLHIDIAFSRTVPQNHSALSTPLDQAQDGVRSASMGSKTAFR